MLVTLAQTPLIKQPGLAPFRWCLAGTVNIQTNKIEEFIVYILRSSLGSQSVSSGVYYFTIDDEHTEREAFLKAFGEWMGLANQLFIDYRDCPEACVIKP